ncbi:DUF4142 domain-containing protein [Acetobacter sp. AN02]|uniref:DUF4142 domain-containing protein n=1 Tax=Acetobacter sp. AN02 TaxID=2894186 RepID=UPI0024345DC3|nr:DUF4142 domain-containing protein [Acetobacter sp. AN02]MDG6095433.1 DUF4142 domain-containing protein [Acetobacter sp. AN02]
MKKIASALCAASMLALAACAGNNPATAPLSDADAAFVQKASAINELDIAIGNLASTNSKNQQVTQFADTLVRDHTDSQTRLTGIATSHNVTLATALNADDQKIVDDLSAKKGTAFDRAFASTVISGHQDAANVYSDEVASTTMEDLKSYASDMATDVQTHLTEAHKLSAPKATGRRRGGHRRHK